MTKRVQYIVLLISLTAMLVLSRCSPRAGRNILSFFFDGVPDRDSVTSVLSQSSNDLPDTLSLAGKADNENRSVQILHYPYREKECFACHDENSLGKMTEPEPGLCFQCHVDFSSEYKVLHGPVAGGYCTACHHPHQSEEAHLLRRTGHALCLYCHDPMPDSWNEVHGDLGDMACTECHNPHGGEDRNILY